MKIQLTFILCIATCINCTSFKEFQSTWDKKCKAPDTSKIALVYIFLPPRHATPETNGTTFKQHHFYSLLLLAKLFNANPSNRILFYYINDSGYPRSNQYHRWLHDDFWLQKIGKNNLKFIRIEQERLDGVSGYDMHDIFNKVKLDSQRHIDSLNQKDYVLMATSDLLIGPKILTCFSRDLKSTEISKTNVRHIYDSNILREKLTADCYESLHAKCENDCFASFLYTLNIIHHARDFSGILIWKISRQKDNISRTKKSSNFVNLLENHLVSHMNNFKCHYKQDVINLPASNDYATSFCVFGYELNTQDIPAIESIGTISNYFNRIIRKYVYGKDKLLKYGTKKKAAIPNIVHLIWFSDVPRRLKFIEYLCLKSILSVLKPDKVRIHGDIKPIGADWNQILNSSDRIEWVDLKRTFYKYGQNFSGSPVQHLADIARLEVLYEEGGIYTDFDILWVKSLNKLRLMDVEVIAANDITSYCNEFPNNIQIGAFLASPKSKFIKKWLDGYRDKYHQYPGDYVAVSMCEPYKLYEKEPHKVFIDNRLQMIYFNGWSAFVPRYIDVPLENLLEFNQKLDFVGNGTYGYHLPRHGSLFTRNDFDKANKTQLPMKIASYILNLPFF